MIPAVILVLGVMALLGRFFAWVWSSGMVHENPEKKPVGKHIITFRSSEYIIDVQKRRLVMVRRVPGRLMQRLAFQAPSLRPNTALKKSFLTPEVRRNLDKLFALGTHLCGRFSVHSNTIEFTKFCTPDENYTLEELVELAHPVFENAISVCSEEGIEFLSHEIRPGGECQICGCELYGTIVRCRNCNTPHHRDCWKFARGCSTYGCGSTASSRSLARVGQR